MCKALHCGVQTRAPCHEGAQSGAPPGQLEHRERYIASIQGMCTSRRDDGVFVLLGIACCRCTFRVAVRRAERSNRIQKEKARHAHPANSPEVGPLCMTRQQDIQNVQDCLLFAYGPCSDGFVSSSALVNIDWWRCRAAPSLQSTAPSLGRRPYNCQSCL
jgi:hypothetical protein